jgi:hypothetical protein
VPGAALQPLDTNQETLSLREVRSQKRKASSPTPQEEELDLEIRDLEAIHQQVQRKGKDALANRPSEEVQRSCRGNASPHSG